MDNSTSLYIHIPFCISKCKYCDFFSVTNHNSELKDNYLQALCREIIWRKEKYNISQLNTIYIGGGTPSLLSKDEINLLFSFIRKIFLLKADIEITIEANPDDLTEELLQLYENAGITRISCGIQSMNEKALSYVSRRASSSVNIKALQLLQKNWKGKFSLDLICGLPEESEESFLNGLQTIVSFNPDHISMYSLTIEDETPLGRLLNSGKLQYDFDFSDQLWLKGKDLLKNSGYMQYEVSNFEKEGNECRHNLVYWNHQNYSGCGSGATGSFYQADGSGQRWTNTISIHKYIEFWKNGGDSIVESQIPETKENVDIENSIFEFFMMGLRKRSGVSKIQFENIFKREIPSKILAVFEKWRAEDLCVINKNNEDTEYFLNEKGLLFLNKFLEEIL